MAERCNYVLRGGVLIPQPAGPLSHDSAELLLTTIEEMLSHLPIDTVVLNLKDATGRSSEALCPILGALNLARKHGKKFAIAHFPETLQRAFHITQLDRVIVVRATIDEAIRDAQ